jgi:CubicO group peptidase (beta-lactamase class C family)
MEPDMESKSRKVGKVLLWVIGVLAVIFILSLVIFSFIYTPAYIFRVIRWGNSDVYDYLKFPERQIDKSINEFHFIDALNVPGIEQEFESHILVDDLDTFLNETSTQALLVAADDELLYEHYGQGLERDSIVTSFSAAKSFASTLIGIAIDHGYIDSVNDPITKYIPELGERDAAFAQITIHDLLKMSSGIKYEELPFFNGDNALTYYYPDLRQLAITRTKIVDQPGEYFLYNNYHPLLLGIIIERATGKHVADFMGEFLWQRIGTEYPASWSLDEAGFEKMESGINARAIDFTKFGRLWLNKGNWEGEEVISETWISESIRDQGHPDEYYQMSFGPDIMNAAEGGYYQYMWYGLKREGIADDFYAAGRYGQIIYVSPEANLIIVRNGETYGSDMGLFDWIDIFYDVASQRIE